MKSRAAFRVLLLVAALAAAGCATAPPKKDYTAFRAANPKSILVIPVVNKSVDVAASDYFLSTLTVPMAERGYYVFPVDVVKHLLEDDGLADASLVHGADTGKLCNLFGADSVLYATIEQWDAKYYVINTTVTVAVDYDIKDCKTGASIWDAKTRMVYTPQSNNSGGGLGALVAMAISAAITKAAPNYLPLARQANAQAFAAPDQGLPAGPYHPEFGKGTP
ncbi:MAG: DUF799 family lipoprotein [Deltaproteobacteria bacterium]|nr:DUF799 family lipoprotein [Deltaproteobacteria bacterium]